VEMRGGLSGLRSVVRVVTGRAFKRASAFQKTCRHTQPVSRAVDLKTILFRIIEEQHEIAERFARPVRERASAVFQNRMRELETGCLEMALHAHLHPAFGVQARWIDNRAA